MTATHRHPCPSRRGFRTARVAALALAVTMVLAACSSVTGGSGTTAAPTESTGSGTPPSASTGTNSAPAESSGGVQSTGPSASTGTTATPTGTTGTSSMASSTGTPSRPVTGVTVVGTIATDLTTPWGLGFLPDGTALVTERDTARLLAIAPGADHAVRTVGTVRGVVPGGEGGLLGLAVSPDGLTVFVYYTAADDNRVAALTLDAKASRIAHQQDILTGIPKASVHNGGRLAMGPDGDLYIGTGDATNSEGAQDLGYLGGKILRITTSGKPAPGNPFADAPLVYSYGHRNVQGLAFDARGRLWASEFGANAYDELNRITPGGNYGWPVVEGPSDNPKYVAPSQYWPTSDASPSGLAVVGETAFMAALRGARLWMIPLTGPAGKTTPVAALTGTYGRLRTVVLAPDGSLWLTTSNTDGRGDPKPGDDRILRLRVR